MPCRHVRFQLAVTPPPSWLGTVIRPVPVGSFDGKAIDQMGMKKASLPLLRARPVLCSLQDWDSPAQALDKSVKLLLEAPA